MAGKGASRFSLVSRFFYLLVALAVAAVAGARRGNVPAIAECFSWSRGYRGCFSGWRRIQTGRSNGSLIILGAVEGVFPVNLCTFYGSLSVKVREIYC